ncbi:MULE transposase domain [Sesbania bispinosa]|nr:MULE transposase domain [Sesbania bispinosa]
MEDSLDNDGHRACEYEDNDELTEDGFLTERNLEGMVFNSEGDFAGMEGLKVSQLERAKFERIGIKKLLRRHSFVTGKEKGRQKKRMNKIHKLLEAIHTGMLPAHRKMTDVDIMQLNSLRKIGISAPHIFGSFASQSGGFHHIRFSKRDMYNEIGRQRKMQSPYVKGAFQYLRHMASNNGPVYWSHTLDSEGRLMRLFWCDGHSQVDYKVFGDVLAFDATYKKNKYHFPLVVFSCINHHNQATIFASGIIAEETEGTYVWLLEQLMVVMKGKAPISLITDGDMAARNVIKRVFPNAHHRLCAWHLLRNANSNVKNPRFLAMLKKCMLGDYEIYEFQRRWNRMIVECRLEENTWVKELYEKKTMWASSYIRGKFFAGIRTTSRCEGLHAQLARFIYSCNTLVDFLQNFHHYVEALRYKEIEADYATLESFRLPCEHIVGVMVHLDTDEIPSCLVLDRWTMAVKERLYELCDQCNSIWDFVFMARCGCLDDLSRKVNRLAIRSIIKINAQRELLTDQLQKLETTDEEKREVNETSNEPSHVPLRDPVRVRTKGCAASSTMNGSQRRRRQKCGLCGGVGHNKKTCLLKSNHEHVMMSQEGSNQHYDDPDYDNPDTFTLDSIIGDV